MAIEDLREIGNVLYERRSDGMLYPVRRVRPDTEARGVPAQDPSLLNVGGIGQRLGLLNQFFNPVEAIGQSMQAGQRLTAPNMGVMDRLAALGDMLSGVAGVTGPAVVAGRAGAPAAAAVMEGLLGGSPTQQAAGDTMRAAGRDVVERLNQPGQMPTTYANPIPGLRLFHGSPHDFDRFSMSKIGTGEGAQAYGHGLYFAENEGIARSYRDNLLDARIPQVNERLKELSREMGKISSGYRQWKPGFADEGKALAEEYDSLLDERSRMKGSMYEVNVNANPEDFLDWDKPLSEQSPKIQGIWDKYTTRNPRWKDPERVGSQYENPTGSDFLGAYSEDVPHDPRDVLNYQRKFTEDLSRLGIPGIRYLDAGSRSAGDGSRNYVVFDENLIEIVRKYGIAGAAAMLGISQADLAQAMQQQQQPQGLLSGAQ
jgi:hypothetical protein